MWRYLILPSFFLSLLLEGRAQAEGDQPLEGRTVGVLIADGFHIGETREPIEFLRAEGATVLPIGMALGEVRSGRQTYEIVRTVDDPELVAELDAVVIPGGGSPARLRESEAVLEFVRQFADTGKPLAAICHGPQVLITAGVLKGRRATCVTVAEREYFDVRDELTAAGATYIDEPVVIDGNILTSRLPDDVPLFNAAVARALEGMMIPTPSPGGAWLGDFGHYFTRSDTDIYLLNPDGGSFTVTLHRYRWVFQPGTRWNSPIFPVTITAPDGSTIVTDRIEVDERGVTIDVPGSGEGVYRLNVQVHGLNYWHLTTSLSHAVASAGEGREFNAVPIVPRRWTFFVPEGTDYFTIRTWSYRGRSQREDHGLTVRSPQGQRMGMLWDNPSPMVRDGEILWGRDRDDLEQVLHVVVEPGSDGRFWSLEVEMGDAHVWSNFPFTLERIPPYVATSPEQWFNPETGEVVTPKLYEEVAFVRKVLPEDGAERWPHFAHWMPGATGGRKDWMAAPALGDNASNQIRTPSRFALWNPEGREVALHIRDYVPRDPAEENTARVRILDEQGTTLETLQTEALGHQGGFEHPLRFEGVRFIEVDDIERYWAFSYPGTPLVLVGEALEEGWHRFPIEAGLRRHWYFKVPTGTRRFEVRADTGNRADILDMDINAPDRTVARFYGSEGHLRVNVPAGLDGKIWHFSMGIGSLTRSYPTGTEARNPMIPLDLQVRGIPPLIAPTWEQWFDPEMGEAPFGRGR